MFKIVEEHKANSDVGRLENKNENGTTQVYNYINNIPLNASNPELLVNFLEYWEIKDGEQVYYNTWITDIELHQDNIYHVMRGGRAGFQIENETFNTLKSQGYNLEHNYVYYEQHLSTVNAQLMMLQFCLSQVQEVACPLFKAARGRLHSRIQLWDFIRIRFLGHLLPSWEILWKSIIYGFKPEVILLDTS